MNDVKCEHLIKPLIAQWFIFSSDFKTLLYSVETEDGIIL